MSFLPLTDRDRLDLTKLHASSSDLWLAATWAGHLLKKRWFRMPWARGKIYTHQSAYVTGIVVAYGRVFAPGRGGRTFPQKLIDYDTDESALHTRLMEMRHKVYAHSDLDRWTVRPWKAGDFETSIVGGPIYRIDEDDLERLIAMTERVRSAIGSRIATILAPYKLESDDASAISEEDRILEAMEQLEVGEMLAIPLARKGK